MKKQTYRERLAAAMNMPPHRFDKYLNAIKREFRVPPPTMLIMRYLESLTILESPFIIAKAIRDKDNYPLKSDKPGRLPPVKFSKSRIEHAEAKLQQAARRIETSKSLPHESNIVPYSSADHERVSPKDLDHCPHGIPRTQICAICEPEKFREITGED